MKTVFPLLALVLAGCSGESEEIVKTPTTEQRVALAGTAERVEGIAMSWEGNAVHVGDGWESAQKLFPERRASYRLRSLPERFGRDFEAHGWETNEGQGYGIVTDKDLVVAAIYHVEDVEDDYAKSLLDAQRAGTGALKINQVVVGNLQWSFWESQSQRLMVLIQKGQKGKLVTILMGDDKVLDALGATRPKASASQVGPFLSAPLPRSATEIPKSGR